ncbi:MAG: EAL and HDOD domain-containing protein, partial [Desulfotomaculales bacterium]
MEVFIARQPIFDLQQRVVGYELLFRQYRDDLLAAESGEKATARVIDAAVHDFGLLKLTGGARVFVNFPRGLLLQMAATLLPPEKTVVEILENVEPDGEVVSACRRLKSKGYRLALDDFVDHPRFEPLVELADIIKVDFLAAGPKERRRLVERFAPRGIRLLAEKVESREDFRAGAALGYSYFQGFFFARPEILAGRDLPGRKLNCLRLLRELHGPDYGFDRAEEILKKDVSLSFKLLRYVNSAWFGLKSPVSSLRRAMAVLGENGLRQWATIVALSDLATDSSPALFTTCLIRARFCELLAAPAGFASSRSELFLTGLFSALDSLVGRPLPEVLDEIGVASGVRSALLGEPGPFGELFG